MLKRIISGFTSLTMVLAIAGFATPIFVYSDEGAGYEDDEIIMLSDEEANIRTQAILSSLADCMGDSEEISFTAEELYNEIVGGEGTGISGSAMMGGDPASPQWTRTTHEEITNDIYDDQFGTPSTSNETLMKTCMAFGARHADDHALHNSDDPNNKVVQLHSIGNYLIHLDVLWNYTRLSTRLNNNLINVLDTSTIKNEVISNLSTLGPYSSYNTTQKKNVDILLDTIPEIYSVYIDEIHPSGVSNYHDLSDIELKYLTLGLALHLCGDIYAHKAYIPNTYANHFFISYNDFTPTNYSTVMTGITNESIRGPEIANLMKVKDTTKYEDNKYFAPERYNACIATSRTFVEKVLNNAYDYDCNYVDVSVNLQNYLSYYLTYEFIVLE